MQGMNRSTIINSALRRLGGVDTNIPTGGMNPANSQAEAAYASVVRRVLSAYDWGFATRYRELAEVAEPPLFGFTKAYQLPSDTVRLVSVHAGVRDDGGQVNAPLYRPEPNHVRSGRIIYCSAPQLFAQVVETGHEEDAHEPFLDACAYALAIEIASAVAHGGFDVKSLVQLYSIALEQAITFDAGEQKPVQMSPILESKMLRMRFGRGGV